jgi:hypothetical protein
MSRRDDIEERITRYKSHLWLASDDRTRDALFGAIADLHDELAALERGAPPDQGEQTMDADETIVA